MPSLKTDGFDNVILEVAEKARLAADPAKAAQIALTLDDRFATGSGLQALTPADRIVVESIKGCEACSAGEAANCLFLTRTGRLTARLGGEPEPADAVRIATFTWPRKRAAAVESRYHGSLRQTAREMAALRDDLAAEGANGRLDRIEYAVAHMAPILIYVNDHVYSNLGKLSNLPGRSLAVGHPRSLLNRLRETPVSAWAPEDACFVACLDVLLASGPPVRAEEFNGTQLLPVTLARFLAERIAGYGGPGPKRTSTSLPGLTALATRCGRLRKEAVARGLLPYRMINGLTLHKSERLMTAPSTLAEIPPQVRAYLAQLLGAEPAADAPIRDLVPMWEALAGRLKDADAPGGFASPFEAVLHAFLTAVSEGFAADVSMSRGPQRFDALRAEPEADPFLLRTGDFYCCVAPRRAFVERFGDDRRELLRALAAYSARMRFNTWHYLPHTLGIVEREPGREDWFFAPTMPDVTEWSDRHHTGHVAFGVRHAIRVPISIDYDGRSLPGLYDLRTMRTGPPPFDLADLRGTVATALLLRQLYQAMSAYEPTVTDFGKSWYERFHG